MAEHIKDLPLEEAKQHPASFLYVYADNDFLNSIDEKHREIIREKGFNQKQWMWVSAGEDKLKFEAYKIAVRLAFTDMYGMDPYEALLRLAAGETIAGKNWNEGIYGIGSLATTFADNQGYTVSKDGHFYKNGKLIPDDQTKVEYANNDGTGIIYKRYYTDQVTKTTYALIYNKTLKTYKADSYSLENGGVYSPMGMHIGGADGSTMWGNVIMNVVNAIINWFLNLLGINTDGSKEQLTVDNTLPSQVEDGFAGVEPLISGSTMLMLMAAGGMLLYGGTKKKGGKRKTAE